MNTPPDGIDRVREAVEAATRGVAPRAPAIEVIEEPTLIVLTCEMGTADREDIRVDVSPHRVVVAALPRPANESRRPDRPGAAPYVDFERAVPLPSEVRPETAEARLNNGVLEVTLPKKHAGGSGVFRLPPL